jgi:putative hemolysin
MPLCGAPPRRIAMCARIVNEVLGMGKADRLYQEATKKCGDKSIFAALTKELGLGLDISEEDRERIPGDGPLIIVANHPTGMAEGLLLPALIDGIRSDLKVMVHRWFKRWPMVAERSFLVDPQNGAGSEKLNSRAVMAAARWVRLGNALLVFPAGEVARYHGDEGQVRECDWRSGLLQLVRLTRARVLPVHIEGRNSRFHDFLARIHPRLGAANLLLELFRKRGNRFVVRVGNPVAPEDLSRCADPEEALEVLRRAVLDQAAPARAKKWTEQENCGMLIESVQS